VLFSFPISEANDEFSSTQILNSVFSDNYNRPKHTDMRIAMCSFINNLVHLYTHNSIKKVRLGVP